MGTVDQTPRHALEQLLDTGGFVLFLGAGVGVEAGLSDWRTSLDRLAQAVDAVSQVYAAVIREEVQRGRFLAAAEQFFLSPLSDEARFKAIESTFGAATRTTTRLRALAHQRFRAIVTTNYDRSLIEAATSEQIDLVQFAETPDDIASARISQSRFLLRLHGRVEVPSSIVLSSSQYQTMAKRPEFEFFVQTLVTDAQLVFFGFSFDDPYLVAVLDSVRAATRGRIAHQSYALLPGVPVGRLSELLAALNITVIVYSPDNGHDEGWKIIAKHRAGAPSKQQEYFGEARLRQTLASVLTHLRLQQQDDLRSAVLSSAVFAAVERLGAGEPDGLATAVRQELALPVSEQAAIRALLARLVDTGQLSSDGTNIAVVPREARAQDGDLPRLSRGVLARAEARYGKTPSSKFDYTNALNEVFLRILIADGMLLAHSLVRKGALEVARVEQLVSAAIGGMELRQRTFIEPLQDAIISLLTRPEADEEAALDEAAAVAFVFCLTLADPTLPATAQGIASQQVFLDASVLLPWLCAGHPSAGFYGTIVESLGTPAVATGYLNEIVSHRDLAIREFTDAGLDLPGRLENFVKFHGLGNINTFVGGFAGQVAAKPSLRFVDYLDTIAPFNDEPGAADFLRKKGIRITELGRQEANVPMMAGVIADKLAELGKPRNSVRIDHDAKMIAYLWQIPDQRRPYFVTADRRLMSAIADSPYRAVCSKLIFPHQAFTISQFTGRARGVVRGLARSVFSMRQDASRQLREFYIDRVLGEYEPALVSAIPNIIEAISTEAAKAQSRGANTEESLQEDTSERVRKFRQLDQFENLFHERMIAEKRARGL
jgi:hypothetical protein